MEKKCGNCRFKHNTSNDRCFACEKNIASGWQPQTNRQWLETLNDKSLLIAIRDINGDHCGHCIYSPNCYGKDCTEGRIGWLQAEHKE